MKTKTAFMLVLLSLLFCVVACGEAAAKRPVDYAGTEWTCESAGISFTVSAEGKVENAFALTPDGKTVDVTIVFSDVTEKTVSFYSADGKELYFSGVCSYRKDGFSVTVSDIYSNDFSGMHPFLHFDKK